MKKVKKVYCINCKHFQPFSRVNVLEECLAPDNLRETVKLQDTWKKPKYSSYEPYNTPNVLNCKNSCKYHKRNWWKQKI